MRPLPHLTKLATTFGIRHAMGASLNTKALACSLTLIITAQVQAQESEFNIPARSMASALHSLGQQVDIQILYSATDVEGLSSQPVVGKFSEEQALHKMLEGTSLSFSIQNGTAIVRRHSAQGATELGTLDVTGKMIESAYGPVDGYVATRSATGTKTDTPLLEIPQAINVVTADQIEVQGARNLTQALRYTPGLGVNGYTDRNAIADEITSRGFAPSPLYLDGAYLPYAGSLGGAPQIDPYTLERVEVLKGPASVLYGQNQPGGIVNMVSKRPTNEQHNQVKFGLGSYHRLNGAFDTSGPIDEQDTLSYRVIGVAKKGNDQVAHTTNERLLLAPSLTWSPSENTSLTLLAQVQRDDGQFDYQALPRIGSLVRGPTGQKIDRDFFAGDSHYNDYKRDQFILGYDFTQTLTDNLKFRSTARYIDVRDDYKGFYLRSFATDANNGTDFTRANRVKLDWQQHNIAYTLDNNLEFKFNTGALEHTTLAGVDYRHFNRKYDGYNAYNVLPVDLYGKNNYDTSRVVPELDTKWDNTIRQVGLYAQDQIKLDSWILTIGGRKDWAEVENKDLLADTITEQRDNKFTGRVGLTYVTDFGLAPYISYSESFLPTVGTTAPERGGRALEPTEGKQYEMGVKYQPYEKTLLTASVFQIKQKNVLTGDVEYPQYQSQQGEIRSRGVELEAKSSVQNVDVLASATYIDSFYTKETYGNQDNRSEAQAPVSATAWVDYHFVKAPLAGLTWGVGARYTGRKPGDAANSFHTPSYVVYDTTLSYDLGKLSRDMRGLQARLNVQNLFDREYVSDCNYSFGCYYGQERVASVEVSYDW